jgi:hypothetical protein
MAGLLRLACADRHHVLFGRDGARGGGSTWREKSAAAPVREDRDASLPLVMYFIAPGLWATAQDCTAPEN